MTTQFPAGIDSFDIRSPQEIIRAMHVNDIQEAIVAIEVFLLGLNQSFNNHVAQAAGAHAATAISVAPTATLTDAPFPITATTVQAALEQLKLIIVQVSNLETDLSAFVTHLNTDINTAHPGSILGSKIANNTITIDKLAFDVATQVELDAHLNTDVNTAHPGLILGSKIADYTIAIQKLDFDVATQLELDEHISSLTAHEASQIVVSPAVNGQITVQSALTNLKGAIDAHLTQNIVHDIQDTTSGSGLPGLWPTISNVVVGRLDAGPYLERKRLVSHFLGSKIVLFTDTVEDLEKEIFAPYTPSASDSQIVVRRPSASRVISTVAAGVTVNIPVVNASRFVAGNTVRIRLAPNYNIASDVVGVVNSVSGSNVNVTFTPAVANSVLANSLLINETTVNPLFEVGASGAVKIQNLTVTAGQTFQGDLTVTQNLTIQGNTILGQGGTDTIAINGTVTHTGSGTTTNNYTVGGLLTAGSISTGDLGSSGLATFNDVNVTGTLTTTPGKNLSIGGNLIVDGYAVFDQTLQAYNFTSTTGLYNNINLPQFRADFDAHIPSGNQLPVFQAGFQHHTDQLAYSSTRILADTLPLGASGIVEQVRIVTPYTPGDGYVSVDRIGTLQVGDTVIVGDGYFGFSLPTVDPWPAVISTESNNISNVPSGVGLQNLDSATSAIGYEFIASYEHVTAVTTRSLSRLVSGNGLLVGEIWSTNGSSPVASLHSSINTISVSSLAAFTTDSTNYTPCTFNFSNAHLTVGQKYFFVVRYLSYTSGSVSGATSTVGFTLPTSNGSTNGIGSQFTPSTSSSVSSVQARLARMDVPIFDTLNTTTTGPSSSTIGLTSYLAATFIPSSTAQLHNVDIQINLWTATGSLYLELYEANGSDIPTGTVLGTSSLVSLASFYSPTGNAPIRFSFASPVSITASTKYIWIIKPSGVTSEPYTVQFGSGATNANTTPRLFTVASSSWTTYSNVEARFVVSTTTSGNITAQIYTINGGGLPNTLLGTSSTVSISTLPLTTPDWVSFAFNSPVTLTAGQEYALTLTWLIPSGQYIKYEYGSYVAGMDFLSTTNGSTWTTYTGQTLRFNATMSSGSTRVSGRQLVTSPTTILTTGSTGTGFLQTWGSTLAGQVFTLSQGQVLSQFILRTVGGYPLYNYPTPIILQLYVGDVATSATLVYTTTTSITNPDPLAPLTLNLPVSYNAAAGTYTLVVQPASGPNYFLALQASSTSSTGNGRLSYNSGTSWSPQSWDMLYSIQAIPSSNTYGASTSSYPFWSAGTDVLDISLDVSYIQSGFTHARLIENIDPFAIPFPRIYLNEEAGLNLLNPANDAKLVRQVAWNNDLPNNVTDVLDTLAGHLYDHINKGTPYPSHHASHIITDPFNFASPFYTPAANAYGVQNVQLVLDQFGQRLYQHLDGYHPNGLGAIDGYFTHPAKDLGYDNTTAQISRKFALLANASLGSNIVTVPLTNTMNIGDTVKLSDDLPFAPETFTIVSINVGLSQLVLSGNLTRNYLTTNNSLLSNYTIETVQEAIEALATGVDVSVHINDGYHAHNVKAVGITSASGMPGFAADNAAEAFVELAGPLWDSTVHSNLHEHLFDLAAHEAQNITYDGYSSALQALSPYTLAPYGTLSYNDVQEAIDGGYRALHDHIHVPIDAHDASAISITAFSSAYFGTIGTASVDITTHDFVPVTLGSTTLLPSAGKVAQTFTSIQDYLNQFSLRVNISAPSTGTIVARLYETSVASDQSISFSDNLPNAFFEGPLSFGYAAGENIGQGISGHLGYLKNFTVFINSDYPVGTTLTAHVYAKDPSTGLPTGSILATSTPLDLTAITPVTSIPGQPPGAAAQLDFPSPAPLDGGSFIVVISQSGITNVSYRIGGTSSTESGYIRNGIGGTLIQHSSKFDHLLTIEPATNYAPINPQLTQTTIDASTLTTGLQLLTFTFNTPHLLEASKLYTLVVENLSSQPLTYYSNTLNLPANSTGFRLVNWSGTSWSSSSTHDLEFRILTSDQTSIAAVNVQEALEALQDQLDDGYTYARASLDSHLADPIDAHDASSISLQPFNNMAATQVQAALQEWHRPGDLVETERNIQNNQVTPVDILGLSFDTTVVRSAHIDYSIYRYHLTPTVEVASVGTLRLIYKPIAAQWILDDTFAGDNVGVTFNVTPAGQVQYTSTDLGSAPEESVIKFRVRVTGA